MTFVVFCCLQASEEEAYNRLKREKTRKKEKSKKKNPKNEEHIRPGNIRSLFIFMMNRVCKKKNNKNTPCKLTAMKDAFRNSLKMLSREELVKRKKHTTQERNQHKINNKSIWERKTEKERGKRHCESLTSFQVIEYLGERAPS